MRRIGLISASLLGGALLLSACGETQSERAMSGAALGAAAGGLIGLATADRDRYDDRYGRYPYDDRYDRRYDSRDYRWRY